MQLMVLTFTDKQLDDSNHLVASCKKNDLELAIVIEKKWVVNAQKISLLYQYLNELEHERIILVVDAFDVLINGSTEEIKTKFEAANCDILFAAEANFYFRNSDLRSQYHKNYPTSSTIYRYLNSGTFIGKSSSLIKLIEDIIESNGLDLNNIDTLIKARSDQYLYAKHFVDVSNSSKKSKYSFRLDYDHQLFEVTGGRMRTFKFPYVSELQAFNSYKLERFFMKLMKLNGLMNKLTDLEFDSKNQRFFNKKTGTNPTIIHIPGSWKSFDTILNKLKGQKTHFEFLKILAFPICLVAYLFALIIPLRIKI